MTTENTLMPNNRERTIDALARNNNIIKSLFHYDKQITFLIASLAFQKIKADAHQNGLVTITRPEIKSLAKGRDTDMGTNKLIELIRKDLESHNFFTLYSPNSGLTDIRQSLVNKTALTKDLFNDLIIHFDESIFDVFKVTKNYTTQSLNQLRDCNENQTTTLYTLTQPYAKAGSPNLKLNIMQLRLYLRIADDAYLVPRTLTMRVKKICAQVTKKTDITLSVIPIKKNGDTGVTIGYSFHAEFKDQSSDIQKIEDQEVIETHKPINMRQQLVNWGVEKKQIDAWIDNLTPKKIKDAIKQTIEKAETNPGGYIYQILGKGKHIEWATRIENDKEVVGCLKDFGLSNADISKVQNETASQKTVLLAVVNKCLYELEHETVNEDDIRQFFLDQLDENLNELQIIGE